MNDKAAIVLFSGELDKAIAALTIANTAAAMGMDVTMFFTFWGLNVLKKAGACSKASMLQRLMNAMNRGLPLSRFDFFGIGRVMMSRLMRDSKMQTLPEMLQTARELGVKLYACTTSMGVMGLAQEEFDVDGCVGAATFINEARKAKVSLFI